LEYYPRFGPGLFQSRIADKLQRNALQRCFPGLVRSFESLQELHARLGAPPRRSRKPLWSPALCDLSSANEVLHCFLSIAVRQGLVTEECMPRCRCSFSAVRQCCRTSLRGHRLWTRRSSVSCHPTIRACAALAWRVAPVYCRPRMSSKTTRLLRRCVVADCRREMDTPVGGYLVGSCSWTAASGTSPHAVQCPSHLFRRV